MGRHTRAVAAVGVTIAVAAIAGCSGSGAHGPAPTKTTANSAGQAQAAAPTESNPPGDIPDNQAYVAYRPTSGSFSGFTVKVPEGWARTVQGDTTTFTDKLNTITITSVPASAAPTTGSVSATVVPKLRAQTPKFAAPKVSEVTRHAGHVVLLTYRGDSAKDPVTGKVVRDAFERYAYYRSGHGVNLTLSGPVNADNVDPWRIVSDSVTWR
ncbi:hypothetical protein ACH4S8_35190 [Streptomyces sp. NPDC021080]|uniref:hypothetical protein n=1 Tax=Streptomyces sp. NPDC021080 TaxID=3365110 RepID=UPI0037A899B6